MQSGKGSQMADVECTAAKPWDRVTRPPRGEGRIIHPDAHEVGEQEDGYPGGDIITMKCPHCGVTWREELPQ